MGVGWGRAGVGWGGAGVEYAVCTAKMEAHLWSLAEKLWLSGPFMLKGFCLSCAVSLSKSTNGDCVQTVLWMLSSEPWTSLTQSKHAHRGNSVHGISRGTAMVFWLHLLSSCRREDGKPKHVSEPFRAVGKWHHCVLSVPLAWSVCFNWPGRIKKRFSGHLSSRIILAFPGCFSFLCFSLPSLLLSIVLNKLYEQ